MFKVTEEVAIDEGGGNLDDALTIELTQAGAKFYLKHGGHQNAGRVYIEWFGIEDLPKIEIPKMPSQQQFQQNMEVMSGHDHSEGYDYHSVKEALDDFLTKAQAWTSWALAQGDSRVKDWVRTTHNTAQRTIQSRQWSEQRDQRG